jgi:D-3-phosphoglycerate dehydrogenase
LRSKRALLVAERLGEAGMAVMQEFAYVECSYNMFPMELLCYISLAAGLLQRLLCSMHCISGKYAVFPR